MAIGVFRVAHWHGAPLLGPVQTLNRLGAAPDLLHVAGQHFTGGTVAPCAFASRLLFSPRVGGAKRFLFFSGLRAQKIVNGQAANILDPVLVAVAHEHSPMRHRGNGIVALHQAQKNFL